jgi:cytochrome c-type biogenesis protein CcmE
VLGLQLRTPREQASRVRRVFAALAIALIVAGAGVSLLIVSSSPGGPLAYRTVDEVMADPAAMLGRELKLHGYLERGSLQSRVIDQRVTRDFALVEHQKRIAVRLAGPVPDTFAERAEVIATGRLTRVADSGYLFEATDVIAKCPSTYQTAAGPVPASRFR